MIILMTILIIGVALLLAAWLVSVVWLTGEDLSVYDGPGEPGVMTSFPGLDGPSEGHQQAVARVQGVGLSLVGLRPKQLYPLMREFVDSLGRGQVLSCEFTAVDAGGVPAEWVRAPGADSSRRVLYLHGGGFVAGSPLSHRSVSNRFAEITGAAVLAIDYRLMPEHPRSAGIEDCRAAYHWILANGPDGPEPVRHLIVGGDSAGGNLSLSLSNWVRDRGLRQPDAVVALSPSVDSTYSSPSIARNVTTDIMLGPVFVQLLKIPAWIRRWIHVLQYRFSPANPVVSPIFADLSGLPPTLIQVSEAEMMLDDARRFGNKARAAGTRAVVQSWAHMLHVWHLFYPQVPEADEAWQEIRKFLESTG